MNLVLFIKKVIRRNLIFRPNRLTITRLSRIGKKVGPLTGYWSFPSLEKTIIKTFIKKFGKKDKWTELTPHLNFIFLFFQNIFYNFYPFPVKKDGIIELSRKKNFGLVGSNCKNFTIPLFLKKKKKKEEEEEENTLPQGHSKVP